MNLKSSKLRKPCKFTVDTKDGKVCKPEKFSRRFSGCSFSIFLGDTIYIYIWVLIVEESTHSRIIGSGFFNRVSLVTMASNEASPASPEPSGAMAIGRTPEVWASNLDSRLAMRCGLSRLRN